MANSPPYSQRFLIARFWRSASGFWRGPKASNAWIPTAVLLGSVLLQLLIQYRLSYWGRDFFDAFGRRDSAALGAQALLFLPLAGASILVAVLGVWSLMTTQRRWRAWLTQHLIDRWLANDLFRKLQFAVGEDQNPEYRIAEDARVAADTPISMAVGLLKAVLSAAVFISILWNVGGDLVIGVLGHLLTVPKYLVIAVAAYSVVLTLAMTIIGRRLVRVIAGKNAAEAQFRSIGSHLRERDMPATRSQGEIEQHHSLSQALEDVIARWRDLCVQLMRTTLVSQGNVLLAPVIAWVLCAPKYLVGAMSLGEVAQVTAAFITVQAALNWLVDNYASLADCLSSINRVASLLLALDLLDAQGRD
ncbi:ABC transporter [Agrobacterium rhizogenes]|uniref:SbmA/BacA-like family transporter n=1 Tax=Rhizobium rhizogenes TaxID=359 RepID=UPI0015717BAD|nr:SbmA/BacA-like family transporter [Rhizobium rhizogenes]NTH16451.1 ABC transporter [Rhizobium rhizogenes]NTI78222.1 ABC transporter [Rhizobium rhizogenes]